MDNQPISLIGETASDDTTEQRELFTQSGTITAVHAKNYIQHRFDLRYYARVKRENGSDISLIKHKDGEFLAGEDQEHHFGTSIEFEHNDELILTAENTDTTQALHHYLVVEVRYD